MQDTDLVLKVNQNCDPNELDLEAWDSFLMKLCEDREYSKKSNKSIRDFSCFRKIYKNRRFS